MTLKLKLVQHQDGKWKALTPETDDLPQVSVTEKSAPINPAQLLNALDSLLSPDGGIRSIDDVPKLASVMKKFSKKFVSRCVYCNVLQATKSDILSEYLDKGGWEIINNWLQDAKSSSSDSFLVEMLKLCKLLPMTVSRLKENNTGKLIKSLMKHEKDEIRRLSSELVNRWMSMIKEKSSELSGEKKKKKEKSVKVEKDKPIKTEPAKEETKPLDKPSTVVKELSKVKGVKRLSVERENKTPEIYEDVKIDPEPLIPVSKKPRTDRPKTAKIYQKKFRATGLEEETPLPKNISKKIATVDKSAVAAAKNALKLNTSSLDRVTEKKIKPESLMTINENANTKGIKLTPPKPRPTYVLQESGSFMDALMSQPDVPIKRKKKALPKSQTPATTSSPTSPTMTLPNFQFYKDTLEMNEENKKEEEKTDTPSSPNNESNSENTDPAKEENVQMDTTEEGGHTPPNDESNGIASPAEISDSKDEDSEKTPADPNELRSILSHGRRRGKKKNVRWVDDKNIKEIFYFEMDDTERVNVSRNFYDLKAVEMKREREAMEMAKRHGDRVEELRRWWTIPVLIDLPPPLVVSGCNSEAKHIEILRQQSTLQEIYFTREMIPDSPHEPDLEIIAPKEPKIIPLDEDNVISSVNDYSDYKPVKPASLPEILSTLMKLNPTQVPPQAPPNMESMQMQIEPQPNQSPLINPNPTLHSQNVPISMNPPYEPGPEPIANVNSLLGEPPPPYVSPEHYGMELQGEWRTPQDLPPNDQFYGGFPQMNQNMPQQPPGIGIRPPGNNTRSNFRGRPRGPANNICPPRSKAVCRHFIANHCRYGMNCTFRHPGVNCPL